MCASRHIAPAGHSPSYCTALAEAYLSFTLVAPIILGTDWEEEVTIKSWVNLQGASIPRMP